MNSFDFFSVALIGSVSLWAAVRVIVSDCEEYPSAIVAAAGFIFLAVMFRA